MPSACGFVQLNNNVKMQKKKNLKKKLKNIIIIISGQLETALGTFYAPKRPLSDQTIQDYRDPISRLARRFFHHLLR